PGARQRGRSWNRLPHPRGGPGLRHRPAGPPEDLGPSLRRVAQAAEENLANAGEIDIPFLILTGTDDRLIDPEGSQELHARSQTKSELKLLPGRYHEPFNDLDSDEVFQTIAEWVRVSK